MKTALLSLTIVACLGMSVGPGAFAIQCVGRPAIGALPDTNGSHSIVENIIVNKSTAQS